MSNTPFRTMSVHRELGAEAINAVVNHPAVRPWVANPDAGVIDLTDVVSNRDNVLLMIKGGGFLFVKLEPGVYEVHSQFVPEARGVAVLKAADDAAHWMFTRTDCVEIFTKVPDGNVAAAALAKRVNGQFLFHIANMWPSPTGLVGVKHYSKTYQAWARDDDHLAKVGHWFHEKLEAAKISKGSASQVHEDDEAHDRYVGAAIEMIAAGFVGKALAVYNRWARLSGYVQIAMIAQNPPVLDIQDAIIAVRENDMEVLLCR